MGQGTRKTAENGLAQSPRSPHDGARRRLLTSGLGAAALAGVAAIAAPAVRGAERPAANRVWRLVTSWPLNAPGPGTTAARIAQQITQLSNGRLTVKIYAAGELVPPLGVFDAVAAGTAEMAHTASLFWSGKAAIAPLFTAAPFGLLPESHNAWIDFGGGQALWDELYGKFGVKPLLAGNSGFQMGGWYNKEITGLDDFKGLKVRMPGLGGEILRRLGGVPITLAPGEIFQALQTGMIDGAEFLGPWSDGALGLDRIAAYYYWPGYHEPNGSAEALINRAAFDALPADLRQLIVTVCAAENQRGMSEAEWFNAQTLDRLIQEGKVRLRPFPEAVLTQARRISEDLMSELAAKDELSGRIIESYLDAKRQAIAWGAITRQALLKQQSQES